MSLSLAGGAGEGVTNNRAMETRLETELHLDTIARVLSRMIR